MDAEGVNGANGHSKKKARSYASGTLEFAQRQLDRIVSPEARQKSYNATASFAVARPILFAFLASQFVFCALPVTLFLCFALSTAVFALVSAVVFTLFWIGVALLVLTPILFFTSSLAVLVWLWAAGTFLVGRWVLQKMSSGDDAKSANDKQVIYYKGQRQNGENGVKDGATDFKE